MRRTRFANSQHVADRQRCALNHALEFTSTPSSCPSCCCVRCLHNTLHLLCSLVRRTIPAHPATGTAQIQSLEHESQFSRIDLDRPLTNAWSRAQREH
jgi:hypothetical protein